MRLVICLNTSRVRTTSQYLALLGLSSCAYIPLLFARCVIVLGGKGIINAPPATLPSLHPDRDIIASRVSVSFQSYGRTRRGSQREGWCRASTVAAAEERAYFENTRFVKVSGNSHVVTSDVHIWIHRLLVCLFVCFSGTFFCPA